MSLTKIFCSAKKRYCFEQEEKMKTMADRRIEGTSLMLFEFARNNSVFK